MHAKSELSREVARLAREVAGDACTISPSDRPEAFWVEGARQPAGIPRMSVVVDNHAASDYANAPHAQRAGMAENIRPWIDRKWREALEQPGTEPCCFVTPKTLLQPGEA
jgi:hypothetical protein